MICSLIIVLTVLFIFRKWLKGVKCPLVTDMTGKVVIITGANKGIGRQTALGLAQMGAQIIMLCRDLIAGQNVLQQLKKIKKECKLIKLDLASFNSVKKCSQQIHNLVDHVDVLIHNAGYATLNKQLSQDGFQLTTQINFLSVYLLTNLLWDLIIKSKNSKIICVNSLAHRLNLQPLSLNKITLTLNDFQYQKRKFQGLYCYSQSKLANLSYVQELATKIYKAQISSIKCVALHPGISGTDLLAQLPLLKLMKPVINWFAKNPKQAAQTSIYLSIIDNQYIKQGGYYDDCKLASTQSVSQQQRQELWNLAQKLTNSTYKIKYI